jgi:hypothetical protein
MTVDGFGLSRSALVASRSTAGRVTRTAAARRERLAKRFTVDGRRLSAETAARGEALGDDLGGVTGTSLDKGVDLDALAKLPKDERKGLIDRAKARRGQTELSRIHRLPIPFAAPTMGAMTWHVQYQKEGIEHLARFPTPEESIESACRLIDEGCYVYAIGTGQLCTSIGRDEIARIYAFWTRERMPFGRAPN